MPFWRREEPVHKKLAREGGLRAERDQEPRHQFHESFVGIHGVHRAREWDAVATAAAPGVAGDSATFVVLADETLLVEEAAGGDLEPLVRAIEARLAPPYRAVAIRQEGDRWGVAANAIETEELPDLPGDKIILTRHGLNREVRIDGEETDESLPALEQLGDRGGDSYALEADRLDGDLWEVRVSPL